jgi:Uncharacterized conserved protein (DUF2358)
MMHRRTRQSRLRMMSTAKVLMLFSLLVAHVNVSKIYGLAFDSALARRPHKLLTPSATHSSSGKCPFSSVIELVGRIATPSSSQNLPTHRYGTSGLTRHIPLVLSDDTVLSPLERWYLNVSETSYGEALSLKCPFFRRRVSDILDIIDSAIRLIVVRNAAFVIPKVSLRGIGYDNVKQVGLSTEQLIEVLRRDWREETKKGYYVTGRLTTSVYRDDCLFDGPDPDMPVRGLRKYMNAASQLFDHKSSFSELLSLQEEGGALVATWRFNGTMRLPWRPTMPEVIGRTTYLRDKSGLIYKHIESWDISAYEAFVRTFFPKVSDRIWPRTKR